MSMHVAIFITLVSQFYLGYSATTSPPRPPPEEQAVAPAEKSCPEKRWIQNCLNCTCNGDKLKFCTKIPNCVNSSGPPANTCLAENGVIYHHNDKWSKDSCTDCRCEHGEIKCLAHFCDSDKTVVNCAPLFDCRLDCTYGLQVTSHGCEICQCAFHPDFVRILKANNVTAEDIRTQLQLYVNESHQLIVQQEAINGTSCPLWVIGLIIVGIVGLGLSVYFSILCMRQFRSTKMEVCKPHDLKKYMNVPNLDTNSNATYKYHNEPLK